MRVVPRAGQYIFHWMTPDGSGTEVSYGIGQCAGDTMTVDYGAGTPAVYRVTDGGEFLEGIWGPDGAGVEVLTRTR